uniref:Uncharacterized protein n=1 Tax=Lepeophtheirus salmonis TaxID=72036 RepID=A0A0K2UP40_LEPSM
MANVPDGLHCVPHYAITLHNVTVLKTSVNNPNHG